jgi:HEPN domain-containing protein
MPPERLPPDDPRKWLNQARSNLARAKARIPEAYPEDLCFDAQQAAEKAIKARFAVVARYPGLAEPVTDTQYQEAVAGAEAVVRWAEASLA